MSKSYPSDVYLETLLRQLQVYLPANASDGLKPKREALIREKYGDIYDFQLEIYTIVRDIDISHFLGMNEVVVDPLVEEYALLNQKLRTLSERLKVMKQFDGDLSGSVSDMLNSFKVKDISSMLFSDLECLNDRYALDLDLKQYMDRYKTHK